MALTSASSAKAIQNAKAALGTRPLTGFCLNKVRTWLEVPGGTLYAKDIFYKSTDRVAFNGNFSSIPAGVGFSFAKKDHPNDAGHIVLSTGGDNCISTIKLRNGDTRDYVLQMPISKWVDYGYIALGYARKWPNGYVILGAATPTPTKKPLAFPISGYFGIGGVTTGQTVKKIQARVGTTVDGSFGPKTKSAVMRWQSGHNLVVDGKVGPKTWASFGFTQ